MVGEDDVEAGVGEGELLAAGLDEREGDAGLAGEAAGVGELAFGEVEADGSGAVAGEGGRPLGAAAAELEDVLAADVAEDVEA